MTIDDLDDDAPNHHGLRRSSLDTDVKRAVRQRCGFGCVICGDAVIEYHHFDPPFKDASEHRAEGITLLCGKHHTRATRGRLSDETVRKHNAEPFARRCKPHDLLDLSSPFHLIIGSALLQSAVGPMLTIEDDVIFSVEQNKDGEVTLSGRFYDDEGNVAIEITQNELVIAKEPWDVRLVGKALTVNKAPNKPVFEALIMPPRALFIRRLNMVVHGQRVSTDNRHRIRTVNDRFQLGAPNDLILLTSNVTLTEHGLRAGPSAFVPYPHDRMVRYLETGRFSVFHDELFGDVYHVAPHRPAHRPPPAAAFQPIAGAPDGMARYPIYCEVCNVAVLGHRDLPEGHPLPERSGMVCSTCTAAPHTGWQLTDSRGKQMNVFTSLKEAKDAAVRQTTSTSSRAVVRTSHGEIEFIFSRTPNGRTG